MKITEITTKILASLMAAAMITGGTAISMRAEEKNEKGTYANSKYELSGLKNPDGSLVQGINYTPLWNYGWFTGAVEPSRYQPEEVRKELKIIKQLGFNSVRMMSPFGWAYGNKDWSKQLLDSYDDFLLACRETGLTADICLNGYSDEDYKAEDSFTRWLLNEWLTRFDEKYSDVIVMYEVSNEPDLNIFTFDVEWGKQQYLTNSEWLNVKMPLLQFIRDFVKDFGTKKPVSVGAMTTSLFTPWDAQNFDVINLHPYVNTVENTDRGFTMPAADMDMETLGYVRPMVFSEIAWVSGNQSKTSDIVQYCRENGIAYYVWGFASNSAEQCFQGIMDAAFALRTSSLGFDMISRYSKHFPLASAGYDDTPAGGGAIIAGSVRSAVDIMKADPKGALSWLDKAAQAANSQLSALAPYWVPDFREDFLTAKGDDISDKLKNSLTNSVLSILPYIRTYGSYENDGGLGGDIKVPYFSNMTKWNTTRGQSFWRARYTANGGKGGSQGIFIQADDMLLVGKTFDITKTHTVSCDVKPATDGFCGIGISCKDDSSGGANPGVCFRVSHKRSADSAAKENTVIQAENTIQVYTTNGEGTEKWRKAFRLSDDMFDADGYVSVSIEYSGKGTLTDPLVAKVSAGGKELGSVSIKDMRLDEGFTERYVCVYGSGSYSTVNNCFDNLSVADSDGKIIFSDTFENGKNDYDNVVYYPETNSNGYTNASYFAELKKNAEALLGKKIKYAVPTAFSAYICDSYLACDWEYSGVGESGFEIQRSTDGENWEPLWRVKAGSRSALIPLYGADAAKYSYRISPITADNKLTKFTDAVKPAKGEGEKDGFLASYTTADGRHETYEVIGNGVFRTSDVNEIESENTGMWTERYVKKTPTKADIKNPAGNPSPDSNGDSTSGTDTSDVTDKPARKNGEKLILALSGAVILAALAGITVFAVRLKKKNK